MPSNLPPIHEGETLTFLDLLADRYASPYEFYRTTYKYTDCGPSVGLHVLWPNEGDEPTPRWLYCDDLHGLGTFAQMSEAGVEVVGLLVSSIVEGTDAEVPARTLEDVGAFVDAAAFWEAWDALVAEVDADADDIWKDTHGCEDCLAHWDVECPEASLDYESGNCPVWSECPACGGHGEAV